MGLTIVSPNRCNPKTECEKGMQYLDASSRQHNMFSHCSPGLCNIPLYLINCKSSPSVFGKFFSTYLRLSIDRNSDLFRSCPLVSKLY